MRTLWTLNHADPGFSGARVLSVSLSLPSSRYSTWHDVRSFHERLAAGIESLPGVEKLGITTTPPFAANWSKLFAIEGITKPGDKPVMTVHGIVGGDYFETMGIPLLQGRLLGLQDRRETPGAILVNRAFARQVFGDADAVGRRVKDGVSETDAPWLTIVGVVGDVKVRRIDEEPVPQTYQFWLQTQESTFGQATYVVRTSLDPMALAPAVRAAVARTDPEQVVGRLAPMPEIVTDSLRNERFRMSLLLAFAATALLLAGIGIAGVTGIAVTQRRHEIGLRMALGAARGRIVREVLGGGLRLVLAGLACGLLGALALSRLVAGFLYGVAPTDPATYLASAGVLLVTGLIATYLPARGAAAVDPMTALRQD